MAQVAIVPLIELALPSIISTFSRYGPGIEISNLAIGPLQDTVWTLANSVSLYEITIPATFTVRFFRWVSGNISSGSYDLGLYDRNFSLLRSIGSTPTPPANQFEELAITPLTLQPGSYWLAFVLDNAIASVPSRPTLFSRSILIAPMKGAPGLFPLPLQITVFGSDPDIMMPLAISSEAF